MPQLPLSFRGRCVMAGPFSLHDNGLISTVYSATGLQRPQGRRSIDETHSSCNCRFYRRCYLVTGAIYANHAREYPSKCTIEVDVDGVADVEVRGDTGWIRTLQGQPSRWVRFECTSAIPRNPADFRFRGIDGRGDVRLIREPGSNGAAVVRIQDPKGGREGYTFDLEWSGNSFASNDQYDPYYDNNRRTRRGNDPYHSSNDPYSLDPYGTDRRRTDRSDPYNRNDPYYGDDRYGDDRRTRSRSVYGMNDRTVQACEDAVRDRARRNHGVRNPYFLGADIDDRRGANDRVIGSFEGNRGDVYDYSCSVNTNNGRIRSVDVRRR
jgi:hypothetical protein